MSLIVQHADNRSRGVTGCICLGFRKSRTSAVQGWKQAYHAGAEAAFISLARIV